jgi:hypothetical protein
VQGREPATGRNCIVALRDNARAQATYEHLGMSRSRYELYETKLDGG